MGGGRKEGMNKQEIFYRERDDGLAIIIRNFCGCHPSEYLVLFSEKRATTHIFNTRKEFLKYWRRSGFIKIGQFR